MHTFGRGILLFIGFAVGLVIAGWIINMAMNFARMILSVLFVSRRLSDPAYPGPDKVAAQGVFEAGSMEWFPAWLPAPARLIWAVSGLVTVINRRVIAAGWPAPLLALLLAWRFGRP